MDFRNHPSRTVLDEERPLGTVLELACGTGIWTQRLACTATSIHAVDVSPEVIARGNSGFSRSFMIQSAWNIGSKQPAGPAMSDRPAHTLSMAAFSAHEPAGAVGRRVRFVIKKPDTAHSHCRRVTAMFCGAGCRYSETRSPQAEHRRRPAHTNTSQFGCPPPSLPRDRWAATRSAVALTEAGSRTRRAV